MENQSEAVLLIGFGGPTEESEVVPFMECLYQGETLPSPRYDQIVANYRAVGGRLPCDSITSSQVQALHVHLFQAGNPLPVFAGMIHWKPLLGDVLEEMQQQGIRQAIGVVLMPYRRPGDFELYSESLEAVKLEHGIKLNIDYLPPWHTHRLFIEAVVERIRETFVQEEFRNSERTGILFTAPSIPLAVSQQCSYISDFRESVRRVMQSLPYYRVWIGFQSRSGDTGGPWLEPDVQDLVRRLPKERAKNIIVVPIGFIGDPIEVLFDLDVKTKAIAAECGLGYARTATVMNHPRFTAMLGHLIQERLRAGSAQKEGKVS
ncbi:MAG: ferrochelatase [Candidatus Omnitrophica bacterium]|nr:ferrochelatase [Candidatus Omnitrophota bacterium]